ncbi:TcaB protein [Staphylococcus piscifermentans]|uniref:Bcr/CflA family efflux transporter n=1 Tax=Staphylococcus piscifermentans TaxID=70258 RepID=A0A239TQC9_9STAP|nr:multidrug effflux MFS transporter [Staphylococcus piscifermentans]RTX85952.1 Bcr/CflA family efflux MFS transporter [Staphylococcus piscifermentans]GEP85609.1 Bcr/CflA family drug resistance efflux transporter [Staphylococcus piscifermentans]SNU99649.1 TcaB protein [Staphylococcus piscifermentans]
MSHTHIEREKPTIFLVIILGALTAIGALSIDMFLPGLPQIRTDFHTTTSAAQLTLTLFMVGLAFGNLLMGPISDAVGRKQPLVIVMIVYTLASLGIIFSLNITMMIGLRLVQGLCAGAAAVISRAIASDMYSGKELTKFLAVLMLVNGVAPVLAPTLGGIILIFSNWHMVFIILTIFGIFMVLSTSLRIPESLSKQAREPADILSIIKQFKALLQRPKFVLPMLLQGMTFVILFSYISASPFITQRIYTLSPQAFSWMFAIIGIGLIISSQLAGKLVDYFEPLAIMRGYTLVQIIGVIIITIVLTLHLPIIFLFIAFLLLVGPVTGIATISFSVAMDERTGGSGSASSLLGLVQTLIGGISTPLVGLMGEHSYIPYLIIISITSVILIILHLLIAKTFSGKETPGE